MIVKTELLVNRESSSKRIVMSLDKLEAAVVVKALYLLRNQALIHQPEVAVDIARMMVGTIAAVEKIDDELSEELLDLLTLRVVS